MCALETPNAQSPVRLNCVTVMRQTASVSRPDSQKRWSIRFARVNGCWTIVSPAVGAGASLTTCSNGMPALFSRIFWPVRRSSRRILSSRPPSRTPLRVRGDRHRVGMTKVRAPLRPSTEQRQAHREQRSRFLPKCQLKS